MVRAKTAMVKYSQVPNFRANLAMVGAMRIRQNMLSSPPMKEKTMPVPRALPASPRMAMGWPSKVVPKEAAVPGMFSKMALIRPPDTPPIIRPMIRAMLMLGSRV